MRIDAYLRIHARDRKIKMKQKHEKETGRLKGDKTENLKENHHVVIKRWNGSCDPGYSAYHLLIETLVRFPQNASQ